MKRFIVTIAVLSLALASFAQTAPTLEDLGATLQGFTDAMAPVLPVNSTVGSTWSDAYIGQLIALPPHFGAGLTTGVTMIPGTALNEFFSVMGIDPGSIPGMSTMTQYGLPFPALALSGRVGGFILPFDIGVKAGWIPTQIDLKSMVPGATFEYLLYGADLRYAILDEKKSFIDLSVGAGYDYLKGSVAIDLPVALPTFTIPTPTLADPADTATLSFSTPSLFLAWESHAVDFTVQASKKILFITPYAGAGLTLGRPNVSSGLKSDLLLDGTAISPADLQNLRDALALVGMELPVDNLGLVFDSPAADGTDVRVYGGVALDILIVHLDLNALYSFIGKNFGATLGLRVQL